MACGSGADSAAPAGGPRGVALVPDTQTVDGVLEMRHPADALARAPEWMLDSVPMVVIDGGEAFDLTSVYTPVPLSGGRFAVLRNIGGAQLVLFGTDGKPERVLARTGAGPGELVRPTQPVLVGGDTLLVVDDANGSVNWIHPDAGLIRTARSTGDGLSGCFGGTGQLADGRLVGVGNCGHNQTDRDGTPRVGTPLLRHTPDFSESDTIALVPGYRMGTMEIRQGSRRFDVQQPLRFGQFTTVTALDSTIVVASGEGGYVLRLMDPEGRPTGRIVIPVAARLVTDALKQLAIDRELKEFRERSGSGEQRAITDEESRRQIVEAPTADTLPAYGRVLPGADGVFWVVDYVLPSDTTWAATGFRVDGTIVGRLVGPRRGGQLGIGPVWFGRDRVMVREVDEDGVVRFGVYGVRH